MIDVPCLDADVGVLTYDGYLVVLAGIGEFLLRVMEMSDLAGDGVGGGCCISIFVAGLAELDGIVTGLSRGETSGSAACLVDVCVFCSIGIVDIGDGVIFKPDGSFNCSCSDRIRSFSSFSFIAFVSIVKLCTE